MLFQQFKAAIRPRNETFATMGSAGLAFSSGILVVLIDDSGTLMSSARCARTTDFAVAARSSTMPARYPPSNKPQDGSDVWNVLRCDMTRRNARVRLSRGPVGTM